MHKNKLFLLLILIIAFLGIFLFYFFSNNSNNDLKNNFQNSGSGNISFDNVLQDLSTLREEISLNDVVKLFSNNNIQVDNILIKNTKYVLDEIKSKQKYSITQNFNGGISLNEARDIFKNIDSKYVRELNLQLEIYDEKNNPITETGNIYVNNINIGEIKNSKFEGNFPWIVGTEYFNVLIRTKNYNDGFLTLNSLNSNGGVLYSKVSLKKAEFKDLDLGVDNNLTLDNYSISIPRCSFIKDGKCFEEEVILKSSFFTDEEVNNYIYSLNMRAVDDKGDVVELVSGGMAFNEFYYGDEILSLSKNAKVEIKYNIGENQIKNMQQNEILNGYWHYSKDLGIWKFLPGEGVLDVQKNTFNIKTNTIY